MEGIILGQYVPGNSFVHRLDPRAKLAVSLMLLWVVFLLERPVEFAVLGLIIVALYFFAGVAGSFWRVLRPGLYLLLLTLFINMFFTPGKVVLDLGLLFITREGITEGLYLGGKLVFLIAVSALITLTTSPARMTDGLEKMLKPLKKARVPVGELAMMMNLALRFIPAFWEEMDKIRKAQLARGADFASRHPGRRIKYMTALLVPLFVSAFRRADELAVAMESRGYSVGMERTSLHELRMTTRDWAVLTIVFILTTAFVFNKYFI